MEQKLKDLLDITYELEGVLHLALKRRDASSDFLRLICKKGKEIKEICDSLNHTETDSPKENTENKKGNTTFSVEEYSIDENFVPNNQQTITPPLPEEINIPHETNFSPRQEFKKGKLIFSINERFRFRKELFDNSDVDFNNTLALIASMESYEEAEDYFINEEGFDKSNYIVKEFLSVIKRYFQ